MKFPAYYKEWVNLLHKNFKGLTPGTLIFELQLESGIILSKLTMTDASELKDPSEKATSFVVDIVHV